MFLFELGLLLSAFELLALVTLCGLLSTPPSSLGTTLGLEALQVRGWMVRQLSKFSSPPPPSSDSLRG